MSRRDLSILDDETQQRHRDSVAENERLTRAGPVEVLECVWIHDGKDGCRQPQTCGERNPDYRVFLRTDPPYTASQLRSVQRVEWDSWWKKRRRGKTQ